MAGPRALRKRKNKVYHVAEKPKQEKKRTCLYWLTFSRVSENKRYAMNDIRRNIALRSAARSAAPRPPLPVGAVPLRIFCRARASKLAPFLQLPARLPSALMLSVYHLPLQNEGKRCATPFGALSVSGIFSGSLARHSPFSGWVGLRRRSSCPLVSERLCWR